MQSAQGMLSLLRSFWSMGRLLKISGRPSVVCSSAWSFSKCWARFNWKYPVLCVRGAVLALDFAWAEGELVLCARLERQVPAVRPEDPARGLPSRCSEASLPVMLALCPAASPGMPSAVGKEGTHASPSAQATLCWVSPGTMERAWLCRPAVGCASSKATAPTHSHPVPP